MRIRLTELLEETGKTVYAVAKESEGRVSTSALYRLQRSNGRKRLLDSEMLEALCDVFGVGPGELLEQEHPKPAKKRRAK